MMDIFESSTQKTEQKKWIISLGGGDAQLPLIKVAKAMGYQICIIDRDTQCKAAKIANHFIQESTHNTELVMLALQSFDHKISAIFARTSGQALYTFAELSKKYSIYGINKKLVALCTVKSILREFAKQHSIPTPFGNTNKQDEKHTFPLVVRPNFPVIGKQAVTVCSNKQELSIAVDHAVSRSANKTADIAQFIEGKDITLLAHLKSGVVTPLAFWDEINQFNSGKLTAIGLATPTSSTAKLQHQLIKYATLFAKQFLSLNYILAFSFRVDEEQKPWLIEVHVDLTGDLILDKLLPTASGLNTIELITRGLLGEEYSELTGQSITPTGILFNEGGHELIKVKKQQDLQSIFYPREEVSIDE